MPLSLHDSLSGSIERKMCVYTLMDVLLRRCKSQPKNVLLFIISDYIANTCNQENDFSGCLCRHYSCCDI